MKDAEGDLWRKEAERLRLLAQKARDEPRRALLSLANEYDDLAVEAFQDAVHHSSLEYEPDARKGEAKAAASGTGAAMVPQALRRSPLNGRPAGETAARQGGEEVPR